LRLWSLTCEAPPFPAQRWNVARRHALCGRRVGYVYVAEGNIGPLAVTRKTLLRSAFRTALKLAVSDAAPQISAFIPGSCEAALSVAVEHGMRVKVPMVLMSSSDFGNWAQYLPRNAGFM
jgi:hypothetical protein